MLLHEELRRAREQSALTQAQLASLAGIPRNQIVRAEKGENITIETLRKIVVHLPVENLTLLEGVKLGFDHLPQAERLYSIASKMMINLTAAFIAALETTAEARLARDRSMAEPQPDDLLPLRALKHALIEFTQRLQEEPRNLHEQIPTVENQGQEPLEALPS